MNPFGLYRGDLQAGIIAATLANIFAAKGQRFTPESFIPRFGQTSRIMTADEILAKFKAIAGSFAR